uniref:Uncharacterized protein n=1 Tax=Anguilla anguilla TaxID=7936 RepID=A0A0E9WDH9_ANGAN
MFCSSPLARLSEKYSHDKTNLGSVVDTVNNPSYTSFAKQSSWLGLKKIFRLMIRDFTNPFPLQIRIQIQSASVLRH